MTEIESIGNIICANFFPFVFSQRRAEPFTVDKTFHYFAFEGFVEIKKKIQDA